MRITNKRDFNAGLMFIVIAAIFGLIARDYSMGSATRMGPGYFPTLLSAIMLFLGVVTLVMSVLPADAQEPPGPTDWRGMGLTIASVASFAILLPYLGFLVATASLVFISSVASPEFRIKPTLFLAVGLIAMGIIVFGYGLELQFDVLPPFLSR